MVDLVTAPFATELIGALCLILGIYPRCVALLLVPLILGIIVTVHGKNGSLFTNKVDGWEYPAFWAVALVAIRRRCGCARIFSAIFGLTMKYNSTNS